MNLYALASFGPAFESRFGGARLVLVFATTGVAGFLTSSYLYAWSGPLTAGASGALFGLIGSEVGFLAIRRDHRAREVFVQYLIIALALGLLMPVNNFAHLGGFVVGLFLGAGLARSTSPPSGSVLGAQAMAVVFLVVVSIFLSLLSLYLGRAMPSTAI
jgi:membrane associated rhomboid family serine protease